MPFLPAIHHPPSHIRGLYAHDVLSDQPWEPIFNIRSRPPWVQIVAFDLFKELTPMRYKPCRLPTFNTISIPLENQARVQYGDLNTLCDTIEYCFLVHGPLAVAYGSPDEKGTLSIKFYKLWVGMDRWFQELAFVIWIDSCKPSIVNLEECCNIFRMPTPYVMEPARMG